MEKVENVQTADKRKIITVFKDVNEIPPLESFPPFPDEDVLSGNPNGHKGIVLFRDPSKRYSIGVWECPPAKFREAYPGAEFGHILEGSATLTNEKTGESQTIAKGDNFFVAFGSSILGKFMRPFAKSTQITRRNGIRIDIIDCTKQ